MPTGLVSIPESNNNYNRGGGNTTPINREYKMETYYAMIDGDVTEIRVPASDVKNNRWEGYVVGKTPTELLVNCGAVITGKPIAK